MADTAPPSYTEATGRPTFTNRPADGNRDEDLPAGWIRQYDATHHHHFWVDTAASPPRSIWHHPYDDETYLKTLPAEERERVQELAARRHSEQQMVHDSTDDEGDSLGHAAGATAGGSSSNNNKTSAKFASSGQFAELPPRPDGQGASSSSSAAQAAQPAPQKQKLGRRMKDKLTGTTHEQRVKERQQRAQEEAQMHAQYLAYRRALNQAANTGQRQLLGRDAQGNEVWVEPPMPGPYGPGYYRGHDGIESGVYPGTRARYIRPAYPYGSPYGPRYGYGYGYGGRSGLGLPIAGGLLGGALLGSLLF